MSDKLDDLIGSSDLGRKRLIEAQKREVVAAEVCKRIAQRHALTSEAVRTAAGATRYKRHVVMARSHAADVLAKTGFKWAQVGRVLCTDAVSAKRMAMRWRDHQSGRLDTISEDQAHAVSDLITAGMSEEQACEQVGVGVTRYQSRKNIMRMMK